jgi:Protein of unknown function (DUF3048) N-terminal domain/Protein of unknown function (DUF3048) C-terminal domain
VTIALTLVVIAAACSGGSKKKTAIAAPPVKTTTTTTVAATTTTNAPVVSPLTGLPPLDAAHVGRPALVVKIDNLDPVARPQTGLTSADICFEEQVEGGITRFACIWQSSNADLVGPVRSTRTTDIAIVSALNHPLYAFSGGSVSFLAQIRAAPIVDVGADTQPNAYFRFGSKPAPHNLYSKVTSLYGFAPKGAGPPPPQFVYRPTGQPPAAAGAGAATHADVKFPGVGGPSVTWDWDGQKWRRGQDGSADTTTDGGQITAANVVFEYVNYPIVGYQTIAGITGPIPMAQLIGQGPAWVLTGGVQVKANWSKPSGSAVTQFTDAAGAPIKLTPGQTWVELVPLGTALNLH